MSVAEKQTPDPELEQNAIHKELDLIQAVVSRMAANSFQLKTWAIGLTGGILAIAKDGLFKESAENWYIPMLVLVILFAFWYLDAYFLGQERLFRKIYERAVEDPTCQNRKRYDLKPTPEILAKIDSNLSIMGSVTLRWFYGIPFVLGAVLLIWLVAFPT